MHKYIQHPENSLNTQIAKTQQICASWNYFYDINISLFCQLTVLLHIVVYCYHMNFRKNESKLLFGINKWIQLHEKSLEHSNCTGSTTEIYNSNNFLNRFPPKSNWKLFQ